VRLASSQPDWFRPGVAERFESSLTERSDQAWLCGSGRASLSGSGRRHRAVESSLTARFRPGQIQRIKSGLAEPIE
jgi:hypothetical protein